MTEARINYRGIVSKQTINKMTRVTYNQMLLIVIQFHLKTTNQNSISRKENKVSNSPFRIGNRLWFKLNSNQMHKTVMSPCNCHRILGMISRWMSKACHNNSPTHPCHPWWWCRMRQSTTMKTLIRGIKMMSNRRNWKSLLARSKANSHQPKNCSTDLCCQYHKRLDSCSLRLRERRKVSTNSGPSSP